MAQPRTGRFARRSANTNMVMMVSATPAPCSNMAMVMPATGMTTMMPRTMDPMVVQASNQTPAQPMPNSGATKPAPATTAPAPAATPVVVGEPMPCATTMTTTSYSRPGLLNRLRARR